MESINRVIKSDSSIIFKYHECSGATPNFRTTARYLRRKNAGPRTTVNIMDRIKAADPNACTRKYFIIFSENIPRSHDPISTKNLSRFNSIPTHTPIKDPALNTSTTLK